MSNGHGEDFSGALIGQALSTLNFDVDALPLVGFGHAYSQAGIRTVGKTKEFSTGGLGYTSLSGRITELLQGQVIYLAQRLFYLLSIASKYDLLVVIGDVVPVVAAWLTGLPVVTYLVAYSSHYEGQLKLPWPCLNCLSSGRFLSVLTRDQLTADDLSTQLLRPAEFLGNPFMDPVLTHQVPLPRCNSRVGLIPGSRRPELDNNLLLILSLFDLFPREKLNKSSLSFDMALVPALSDVELIDLVAMKGWELHGSDTNNGSAQLVRNHWKINIHRDSFVNVLQSSDVLLCMAGTATEQAAGLAKPIVQLLGNGPQFTQAFAEAQQRLLGPTIFCAKGKVGEELHLINTGQLIFDLLERIQTDSCLRQKCNEQALLRLGGKGGAEKIAKTISELILCT